MTFDRVLHKRSLIKLISHGVQGDVFQWVENWLNNHKQKVDIKGIASKWSNEKRGLPQNVLERVLFLIHI